MGYLVCIPRLSLLADTEDDLLGIGVEGLGCVLRSQLLSRRTGFEGLSVHRKWQSKILWMNMVCSSLLDLCVRCLCANRMMNLEFQQQLCIFLMMMRMLAPDGCNDCSWGWQGICAAFISPQLINFQGHNNASFKFL